MIPYNPTGKPSVPVFEVVVIIVKSALLNAKENAAVTVICGYSELDLNKISNFVIKIRFA